MSVTKHASKTLVDKRKTALQEQLNALSGKFDLLGGAQETLLQKIYNAEIATEEAKTAAETAKTGAESARDAANSAKSTAESKASEASNAKADAETAKNEAVSAKNAANQAKTDAQAQAVAAGEEKALAIDAKNAADDAKNVAVAARDEARVAARQAASAGAEAGEAAGQEAGAAAGRSAAEAVVDGKADLVDGKVPETQLPSYVDDVLEYASLSVFPATGERGKIYVALDTDKEYRWSGTQYTEISKQVDVVAPADATTAGKAADALATKTALEGKLGNTGDQTLDGELGVNKLRVGMVSASTGFVNNLIFVASDQNNVEHKVFLKVASATSDTQINLSDIIAGYSNLAPYYSESKTYAVGTLCWYRLGLYRCTTAIETAEAWTAAHWTEATIEDVLAAIRSALDGKAPLASPALTGTPTSPNLTDQSADGQVANKKYVDDKVAGATPNLDYVMRVDPETGGIYYTTHDTNA